MIEGSIQLTRKKKLPEFVSKFVGKKIKFTIPSGWHEITLEKFQQMSDDMDFLELFSLLSGVDIEVIRKCDPKEVAYIVDQMSGLYDPKQLNNSSEYVESFTLNGIEYHVNPNLANESAGAWWDIKKLESDLADKPMDFIPKMLAVLCRPKGEEYSSKLIPEREKLFLQLDVETAFKIRTFFLLSQVLFLKDTDHSLRKSTQVKKLLLAMICLVKSSGRYLLSLTLRKTKKFLQRFSGIKE